MVTTGGFNVDELHILQKMLEDALEFHCKDDAECVHIDKEFFTEGLRLVNIAIERLR